MTRDKPSPDAILAEARAAAEAKLAYAQGTLDCLTPGLRNLVLSLLASQWIDGRLAGLQAIVFPEKV